MTAPSESVVPSINNVKSIKRIVLTSVIKGVNMSHAPHDENELADTKRYSRDTSKG